MSLSVEATAINLFLLLNIGTALNITVFPGEGSLFTLVIFLGFFKTFNIKAFGKKDPKYLPIISCLFTPYRSSELLFQYITTPLLFVIHTASCIFSKILS